ARSSRAHCREDERTAEDAEDAGEERGKEIARRCTLRGRARERLRPRRHQAKAREDAGNRDRDDRDGHGDGHGTGTGTGTKTDSRARNESRPSLLCVLCVPCGEFFLSAMTSLRPLRCTARACARTRCDDDEANPYEN